VLKYRCDGVWVESLGVSGEVGTLFLAGAPVPFEVDESAMLICGVCEIVFITAQVTAPPKSFIILTLADLASSPAICMP
jgi:hypothetical protein